MPLNAAIQRIQRLMGSTAFLTDGVGGSAQTPKSNRLGLMHLYAIRLGTRLNEHARTTVDSLRTLGLNFGGRRRFRALLPGVRRREHAAPPATRGTLATQYSWLC